MHEPCSFDYAIIRIVPLVERGEFLNAGVILFCSTESFLDSKIEVDLGRLAAFAPSTDVALIHSHLAVIPKVCRGGVEAGPIGRLSQRERFHWLVAPRSTLIQMSPVHSGIARDLPAAIEQLMNHLVRADKS